MCFHYATLAEAAMANCGMAHLGPTLEAENIMQLCKGINSKTALCHFSID